MAIVIGIVMMSVMGPMLSMYSNPGMLG
jgi:hypothetical protein